MVIGKARSGGGLVAAQENDIVLLRAEEPNLSALARRKPRGRGLEQALKSRVGKLKPGHEIAVGSSLTARVPQKEEMVDIL